MEQKDINHTKNKLYVYANNQTDNRYQYLKLYTSCSLSKCFYIVKLLTKYIYFKQVPTKEQVKNKFTILVSDGLEIN